MSERIRVFIASSSEQIEVARSVKGLLRRHKALEIQVWDEGVFEFSKAYIESLEQQLEVADYAIVILTATDVAHVRHKSVNLPRDNVIFELGLFYGRLGRSRCCFFVEDASDTQIASDLSGVEPVWFSSGRARKSKKPRLDEQVDKVGGIILRLGTRYKPTRSARQAQERLWRFSTRIAGHWWERMRKGEDKKSALSFLTVRFDPATNEVDLEGKAYDLAGEPFAEWWSVMTDIDLRHRPTIHYYWNGERDSAHGEALGGQGKIIFYESLEGGRGFFWDTNFSGVAIEEPEVCSKNFRLYRCEDQDVEVMTRPWSDSARGLILQRVQELAG